MTQGVGPEFKTPVLQKKGKKIKICILKYQRIRGV
jgi:hypothetical protein